MRASVSSRRSLNRKGGSEESGLIRFAYGWYLKEFLKIKFNKKASRGKLNVGGTSYSETEFNDYVAEACRDEDTYVPDIYAPISDFARSRIIVLEGITLHRLYLVFKEYPIEDDRLLSLEKFKNSPLVVFDILVKHGKTYLNLKQGGNKKKAFTSEELESFQLNLITNISKNKNLEDHEIVALLRRLSIFIGLLVSTKNSVAKQEILVNIKVHLNSEKQGLYKLQKEKVETIEAEIEKYLEANPLSKTQIITSHIVRYWSGYVVFLLLLVVSIIAVSIYSKPEPPKTTIKIPSKLQKDINNRYFVIVEYFDYYNSTPDDRLYYDIYDPINARLWFDKAKKEPDDSSKWFHLGQALSLRYDFIDAYIERGKVKVKLGFFRNAIDDFNHALRFVYHPYILIHRAKAKEALADYEGAILDCDTAIRIDPTDAEGYIYRGSLKLQNAGYAQYYIRDSVYEKLNGEDFLTSAIADFDTALTIEPNNYIAYRFRGGLKHDLRKFDEAIEDFQYALSLSPHNEEKAQLYHMLAWAIVDKVGVVVDDYTGGTYSKEEYQALVASYAFADSSLKYADKKHPGFFRYQQLRTHLYFKLNAEKTID